MVLVLFGMQCLEAAMFTLLPLLSYKSPSEYPPETDAGGAPDDGQILCGRVLEMLPQISSPAVVIAKGNHCLKSQQKMLI